MAATYDDAYVEELEKMVDVFRDALGEIACMSAAQAEDDAIPTAREALETFAGKEDR